MLYLEECQRLFDVIDVDLEIIRLEISHWAAFRIVGHYIKAKPDRCRLSTHRQVVVHLWEKLVWDVEL